MPATNETPATGTSRRGLSAAEAARRLAAEGPNELPGRSRRGIPAILLDVLREPMLALLLVGGGIYFLLDDLAEALILMIFAGLSVTITIFQELRTERVLEALRDLTSPRALVIRDGERQRIAGRDVVRGDFLVLSEGDRVAADARVLDTHELEADESLLTGESVPVRKRESESETTETVRPGGDLQPYVYSGSLIVRGSALCEVTATGARSEIGRIGMALGALDREPPLLQAQMRRLVRFFAVIGVIVSLVAVLLHGFLRGTWLDAVLAGIALGMSMLPEEFPVILTVFMAMGAWRISRARVLTRRSAAIEALGSATVLCTDKTGTLTENRMAVAALVLPNGERHAPWTGGMEAKGADAPGTGGPSIPEAFRGLARCGILASALDPFDPMEKALHALQPAAFPAGHPGHFGWELAHEYGLKPDLLAVTEVWADGVADDSHTVAAKGAPEAIAMLCGLDGETLERVRQLAVDMAGQGLRVLGVAEAAHAGRDWPETPRAFAFRFLGLVGFADPLRREVPAAVAECQAAGIRVVMITGDYPATALAIARQAGITGDGVVTGEEIAGTSAEDLPALVASTNVFARVMPEQKLTIVQALKAAGEVVAMTGDGVNDAPSLKAAHIGIAMGGRGTDVAREAASIVLLDDDFGSIVRAIRLGRRIYDNMRKATLFVLSIHLPIAGLALVPLVFGTPIVFWPVHIALLEMAIDPICSLVFEAEAEEDDVMRRPPRRADEQILPVRQFFWGMVQGGASLAASGVAYFLAQAKGLPIDEIRALTFLTLILSIVVLVLVNRSFSASLAVALTRPNPVFLAVVAAVLAIVAVTFYLPAGNRLFRFAPPDAEGLLSACGIAVGLLLVLEIVKLLLARTRRRQ